MYRTEENKDIFGGAFLGDVAKLFRDKVRVIEGVVVSCDNCGDHIKGEVYLTSDGCEYCQDCGAKFEREVIR